MKFLHGKKSGMNTKTDYDHTGYFNVQIRRNEITKYEDKIYMNECIKKICIAKETAMSYNIKVVQKAMRRGPEQPFFISPFILHRGNSHWHTFKCCSSVCINFPSAVACFQVLGHSGPLGSQRSHGTGPTGSVSNLSLHGQQQLH